MIYEFKCKATGNLIMTQAVGDQVLDIIGKRAAKGVITVLEMPLVMQSLKSARTRAQAPDNLNSDAANNGQSDSVSSNDIDRQPTVSLAQRLMPFIEMVERAHAAEKDIVWGV